MQTKSITPETKNSSPSLRRRAFMTGTAAATIAIGAPAVALARETPADNHDLMRFDMDAHDETRIQCNAAIIHFDELDMHKERPPLPSAIVRDVLGDDHCDLYYHTGYDSEFRGAMAFEKMHRFFEVQLELAANRAKTRPEWAEWPMVKAQDYAKMISHMRKQHEARTAWEAAVDMDGAERAMNALQAQLYGLEDRICNAPCLSLRDIAAKVEWVEHLRASGYPLDEDDLAAILQSMKDFTNCRPAAASGQHLPALA